ncbi:DsrE family protein [Paraburkholderia youngii]|uniref:DsrE family protein n=1 Tax=Paraburkholderia youngii TaxID=2782701 RepID=UPI003D1C07CE
MFNPKSSISGCVLAVTCAGAFAAPPSETPDFWITPTIAGYGKIHMPKAAAYTPATRQHYKIVFAVTRGAQSPSQVNESLDRVARSVNLYVASGVPIENLHFTVIVSGAATPLALDDAHYRAKFGVSNPYLLLIDELRRAGIDVAVCAQALAEYDFDEEWKAQAVTLALSGLTTATILEQQGYSLFPL